MRREFGKSSVRGLEMKLLVFGATGRTGKLLVEQALASGDHIIVYVRTASKLDIQNGH
jgi:putative NADH-flavin reductase